MRHSRRKSATAAIVAVLSVLLIPAMPLPASAGVNCNGSTVSDAFVFESNSGTTNLVFTVAVAAACSGTVRYAAADGSATPVTDYTPTSGTLTFATDSAPQTVSVPIIGDIVPEFTDSLLLNVDSDTFVFSDAQGFGRIIDNDGLAKVLVFDNGTYVDTTDSTDAEADNVQAALATFGDTVSTTTATDAAGLTDALAGKEAFVIPELEKSTGLDAALDAAARQAIATWVQAGGTLIQMRQFNVLNAVLGHELTSGSTASAYSLYGSVANENEFKDDAPTIGSANATRTVAASSLPTGGKVVYGSVGVQSLADPPPATDAAVVVIPEGDGSAVYLGWDWFNSNPGFGGNASGQEAGWSSVLADAVQKPLLTNAGATVTEGDTGSVSVDDAVTLSHKVSEIVRADYATADATAVAGQDYTAKSGSIAINAGSTTASISTSVLGDLVKENTEAYSLVLSNARQANFSIATASVVVNDNDPAPVIQKDVDGYRLVATDGGVFTFGQRNFQGSLGSEKLNKPIVGGATNPAGFDGYWLVASDGGVFSFNAEFHGSLAGQTLGAPAVEIEPTPTGKGYWIVLADGKVYTFGDANHFGDTAGKPLNKPIVGMATTASGKGYWLIGADGGVFNFGDAGFFGSTGDLVLNKPVVDIGPTADDKGYYVVATDGGVFTFGNAVFRGSEGGAPLNAPVVSILVTTGGDGYWLGATDGGVFSHGSAPFFGSMGGIALNGPMKDFIF